MIVAERRLVIRVDEDKVPVPIRLFAPEANADDWACRYEIEWPHGRRTFNAHGVDGIQALMLACQMIAAELYASPYHEQGRLVWEEPGKGYGFPLPRVLRDKAIGEDADGP